MNFVLGFRVADRHDGCAKKAGGIETLLAIVIAVIFHRESRPVEYLFRVRVIKAVLLTRLYKKSVSGREGSFSGVT